MRNTFIMYDEWADMIEELTESERGELLLAIMRYQTDQEIPELSPCARVAFAQIKMQFKKDSKKYDEQLEKRKEASRLGVEARKQKLPSDNQTLPSGNQVVGDSVCVCVSDSDSVSDSVSGSDSVVLSNENQKKESDLKVTRERFIPPTVDEVREYAAEKGYAIDAEHFVDFYQSKGWMVGKNKMKDWKSAVRNWDRQERQGRATKPSYMDAIADRVRMVDDW